MSAGAEADAGRGLHWTTGDCLKAPADCPQANVQAGPLVGAAFEHLTTALLYRPAGQRRWRSRKSSVARLKVSGSSCSPACDRWSKTTRSHPLIRLLIRSANRGEQTRS